MKRGMLIFKKSAMILTSVVIAGQIIALNPDGSICARLTGSFAPITVEAAELEQILPSGAVTYINNPGAESEPVFVANPDGTYSLTMYAGTLVNFGLFNTSGGTPMPLQESTFAEFAPASDNNGVYINAMGVGTQQVQFQSMVGSMLTGNVITLNLTVVDAGAPATVTQPATEVAGVHPGVANGFYSYADDHKIVSTDGNLELDLDNMTWHGYVGWTAQQVPVVYFAEDGMLTIESYGQSVEFAAVSHLNGYRPYDGKNCIWAGRGGIKGRTGEGIDYGTILSFVGAEKSPTTQLPIRCIKLGRDTEVGIGLGSQGVMVEVPVSLTKK